MVIGAGGPEAVTKWVSCSFDSYKPPGGGTGPTVGAPGERDSRGKGRD